MDISEIIRKLNTQIKQKFDDFSGAYLYGSYAKGDYRDDSDVDIVLLFNEIDDDKISFVYDLLGKSDYENNIVTMGLLYTKERLEKNYVFHNEVVNKGIYYNAA